MNKYKTLREYISDNEYETYECFQFYLDDEEINVYNVRDFECYYQPHILDDYVVTNAIRFDNGEYVPRFQATHRLTIEKKETL